MSEEKPEETAIVKMAQSGSFQPWQLQQELQEVSPQIVEPEDPIEEPVSQSNEESVPE